MTNWKPNYSVKDVEIISENTIFDNKFATIVEKRLHHKKFNGSDSGTITRFQINRKPSICVILFEPKEQLVILIEQFRSPLMELSCGPWILEAVAGLIEDNEEPESAAFREAKEEAGCKIKKLIPIGKYLTSCGISDETTHAYCGIIEEIPQKNIHGCESEQEDIKIHTFTINEAKELVNDNTVIAANAIITLQWLLLNYNKIS